MKKATVILFFLSIFLFISCENFVASRSVSGNNDISFKLGNDFVETVSKTVTSNEKVPDNPEFQIVFDLLQGTSPQITRKMNVLLSNLAGTDFSISGVPYGNDYEVSLKIFYKDILIFEILSNNFFLNESNSEVDLQLRPVQINSKINFELNDGKFPVGTQKPLNYFINSKIELPEPEKDGYNFDGWFLEPDCSGERVTHVGKNLFIGDLTLYALWTGKDQIAGVNISPSNSSQIDFDDTITLSCDTPGVSIYYTTDGSVPGKNSLLYNAGSKITVDNNLIADSDTFVIKAIALKDRMADSRVSEKSYTMNRYTVTFNRNNHGTAPGQVTNLKKDDLVREPGKLSATGYIFGDWYKESSCTNKWDFATDKINKSINLYAKWTPITYKVTYNINNGDEGTMAEQDFTYDVSANLRKNTFKRSGYEFKGWGKSSSGNVAHTDEKSVKNLSTTNNATVELFAIWENIAPGPVTSFAASVSGDKIHLSWTNPTVTDVAKVVINSTDAGITNQEVDVRGKYGKTGSVDVAIGSGNLGKGTYNFTAKTVDKENLECISGDIASGSIKLPTINNFSVPNGRFNKAITVVVTGTNFKSSDIQSSDFKIVATGSKVSPSGLKINSDTELQFNIPASGSAVSDTITVNCIGATSKQDTFEIKADYAVGDIVMTDDTLLTGDKCQNYKGKAKPVAVIFRARAGSSSAMGLGFYYKHCIWAKKNSPGYNKSLNSIATIATYESADKDGSDNWSLLQNEDPDGSTNPAVNYPAFYYSNNYGSNFNGTSYSSGWYLPSLGELLDIGKAKGDLKSTLSKAKSYVMESTPISKEFVEVEYANSYMWTSNQASGPATKACGYNLYPNNVVEDYKDKADDGSTTSNANAKAHACAVRKF